MLSRRDLVGKLAAGAAGVAALAVSGSRAAAKARADARHDGPQASNEPIAEPLPRAADAAREDGGSNEAPAAPPPWELVAPLTQGATVADGWRVADLSGPAHGACVLTLQNERGRMQRIHLCRNDGRPQGLVYTERFDLVVMNGGRGDLGTDENLGRAVAAVAHVVAANEHRPGYKAIADAMLPHAERLRQFSTTNEWTLR